MGADDVFPAEMANHPSSPIPALDNDTAERLLSARLDPDDAPPAYAGVARLVQAAAAPPHLDELAGREAALAMFRATWVEGRSGRARGGSGPSRPARVRGRLVAVALAGVLVVGGAVAGGAATGGLWTTGGAPSSGRLRSPEPKASKGKAGKAKAGKPGKPKAEKPAPRGPKATHSHGATGDGGSRRRAAPG
jgi:hypothetical protein